MNVLTRNYFRILREGAFGERQPIEPMSSFKWHQLRERAHEDNVESYLPGSEEPHKGLRGLSEYKKGRRHKNIEKAEYHAIDTSIHSLDFLELIASNVHQTIAGRTRIDGIIEIGHFLRTKGDKVDFIKIEQWLHKLGIYNIAQLHASILIELFGFTPDEVPFIHRTSHKAVRLATDTHKLTLAFLPYYPAATLHSMFYRLHKSITQIEE